MKEHRHNAHSLCQCPKPRIAKERAELEWRHASPHSRKERGKSSYTHATFPTTLKVLLGEESKDNHFYRQYRLGGEDAKRITCRKPARKLTVKHNTGFVGILCHTQHAWRHTEWAPTVESSFLISTRSPLTVQHAEKPKHRFCPEERMAQPTFAWKTLFSKPKCNT